MCMSPFPFTILQLQHAVSHPNSESVIFEQLLGLASHEGLGLPIRAPKPSHVAASAVSINTISDSLEQVCLPEDSFLKSTQPQLSW